MLTRATHDAVQVQPHTFILHAVSRAPVVRDAKAAAATPAAHADAPAAPKVVIDEATLAVAPHGDASAPAPTVVVRGTKSATVDAPAAVQAEAPAAKVKRGAKAAAAAQAVAQKLSGVIPVGVDVNRHSMSGGGLTPTVTQMLGEGNPALVELAKRDRLKGVKFDSEEWREAEKNKTRYTKQCSKSIQGWNSRLFRDKTFTQQCGDTPTDLSTARSSTELLDTIKTRRSLLPVGVTIHNDSAHRKARRGGKIREQRVKSKVAIGLFYDLPSKLEEAEKQGNSDRIVVCVVLTVNQVNPSSSRTSCRAGRPQRALRGLSSRVQLKPMPISAAVLSVTSSRVRRSARLWSWPTFAQRQVAATGPSPMVLPSRMRCRAPRSSTSPSGI